MSTDKCQLCGYFSPSLYTARVRDPLSSTIIHRQICITCKVRLGTCLCKDEDCACSKHSVFLSGNVKTAVACDHCTTHHCKLLDVPTGVCLDLVEWAKHAYSNVHETRVINGLLNIISSLTRKEEKERMCVVMFAFIYYHKRLYDGKHNRTFYYVFKSKFEEILCEKLSQGCFDSLKILYKMMFDVKPEKTSPPKMKIPKVVRALFGNDNV